MKIKKIMISIIAALTLLAPAVVSGTSYALFSNSKTAACQGINLGDPNKTCGKGGSDLQTVITNVVNVLTIIVGLAAVVMIIVGGFKFITSGGDSSKSASARTTVVSAIIGLVIVALAQVIVQFVIKKSST